MIARSVFQFVPIVNSRDAIGKLALNIHRFLKRNQIPSKIFTERQKSPLGLGPLHAGLEFTNLKEWAQLRSDAPEVLIYHHSIGTSVAEHFVALPAERKIVIYHGITPPDLLQTNQRTASEWGLEQARRIAPLSDIAIGFSSFTCGELKQYGARRVVQLPYYFPYLGEFFSGLRSPLALIVGRVVRHKRVIEGIQAAAELKKVIPRLKLQIIGTTKADREYVSEVLSFVQANDFSRWVKLRGRVSQWELNRLYRKTLLLLILSKHEGFCVPVIEALANGVNVVGVDGTALSETIGKGGMLAQDSSIEAIAEAAKRCVRERDDTKIMSHLKKYRPEGFETAFLRSLQLLRSS